MDLEGRSAFQMARGYGPGDVVTVIIDPILEVVHFGVNGDHIGEVPFWLSNDVSQAILGWCFFRFINDIATVNRTICQSGRWCI